MLVRYWQPWREIEAMRHQFDQMFEELAASSKEQPDWTPAVELKDVGDELVLRVQLPGIDPEAVDIQVAKQGVSIAGEYRHEHKTEEHGYFKSEFRYGSFRRVVPLPVAIENEQVKANYNNGILTLTLPKVAEVRNKVVKVNLAELNRTPADAAAINATTEAKATA